MDLFAIGSCRSCYFLKIGEYPNDFCHTTKEILQILKININKCCDELRLMNRTFSSYNRYINEITRIRDKINNSNIIILEISSIKTVYNSENNLYFNINLFNNVLFKVDVSKLKNNQKKLAKLYNNSEKIIKNTTIKKQNKNEIINDLNKICEILKEKKIILVPHVNAKVINNTTKKLFNIPERVIICDTLKEFSELYNNIYYFNPMDYLKDDYKSIFTENSNGHYSDRSFEILKTKLKNLINKII